MTTRKQVLDLLSTGETVQYDSDWNAEIRDADAQPKTNPRTSDYPQGRRLSCGHMVYNQSEVMTSSQGSCCADCYDRMSN